MQWLMTSHVRGHHRHHNSSGHVWRGRFKSFLVKDDEYLLTVLHYIEGNPVRAGIVNSARYWPWSSHQERTDSTLLRRILADPPILLPEDWTAYVDQPLGANDLKCLGQSVRRQTPYGDRKWQIEVCDRFGLESTLRRCGRPKKG